ncbi:MAG: 3-phosphoshikimate 1-carboxyvinyltransferase [Streptosporangiaceae bacterium]|nr:3-phosphoshikimate 1-carboxyvinyltransferase [Streptosporangiaceae bacterium]MBV9854678.1 3-phosphoshikimate 1-carboxyvinyltransferase [Streptosporangiaceae bacterium]
MDSGSWQAPHAEGPVHARLRLPGSKSVTNRALVLAALSDGPSVIEGPLRARDTLLAAAALRAMGTTVEDYGTGMRVAPGQPPAGAALSVDVGNAGTVMRFLPAVAALTGAAVRFDGDARARERPVGALLAALRTLGAEISDGGRGALPFTVSGRGSLRGGTVTLDASGSSQLVSGLLLAAPRFAAGAEIRHSGPPVPSAPHIEMTVRMLRAAGAAVETGGTETGGAEAGSAETGGTPGSRPGVWRVLPGRLNLGTFTVEPDLSNAVPFLAAALVTGGSVTLPDWPASSLQAADQILQTLARMGAACSHTADGLTVTGTGAIRGIDADLRDIPELCLPLTAAAALASSPSVLTGVGHTRAQETDRLAAIAKEINALGGDVTELPGGLRIRPRPLRASGREFDSYDDHRMVMAAAVLGLAVPGIRVLNAATVGKTFPGFAALWAHMLGGRDAAVTAGPAGPADPPGQGS